MLDDPATIIGVTSNITPRRKPEKADLSQPESLRIDRHALTNFQLLDYLRAFLNNRLAWTRWNLMLCSVGAFAIWRRDIVMELGGFSSAFTCEDIEFTFRVHERLRREKRPFRIVALPDSVGQTEGPDTVARLVSQRPRWQRVITETVWHYRRTLFNPRYGTVGLIGAPYYLLVEVLSPLFQVVSVASLPLAWWEGMLDWREFLLLVVTVACASGLLTNMSILLYDRSSRAYPLNDLVQLMLLGWWIRFCTDRFSYSPKRRASRIAFAANSPGTSSTAIERSGLDKGTDVAAVRTTRARFLPRSGDSVWLPESTGER